MRTCITVVVIYVLLLYVLPQNQSKETAIDPIPNGKGELVTMDRLYKRNRWTIFAKNAVIGMIAAAAAISGSCAANFCSNVASPACWSTFVPSLLTAGLAYAMAQDN